MDKIDRLLDALDHPETFTTEQLEELLRDPEVKETLDVVDKMKSSLLTISTPDVDEEWKAFTVNHSQSGEFNNSTENHPSQSERKKSFQPFRFLSRNVAAVLAIVIASFTAIATLVGVGIHEYNQRQLTSPDIEMSGISNEIESHQDAIINAASDPDESEEIIVFDDETLETIMSRISDHYGYEIAFNNSRAKALRLYFRWDKSLPIKDIVERLNNFRQISVTIKDKTINID